MTTIVTTSIDNQEETLAKKIAAENDWTFVPRNEIHDSTDAFFKIIVVEKNKISLRLGNNKLFFHPGLSLLRIDGLKKGQKDRFLEATLLQPGDTLLDCTLGLASDAIVASYFLGKHGKVIGLEAIKEIAFITRNGIENYCSNDNEILSAMKRIEVINSEASLFLQSTNLYFDCIYFDAMFKMPNLASSAMNMLRPFAFNQEITQKEIKLAIKKAKKCVVMKERSFQKLRELCPDEIFGGRNAKIYYARWCATGDKVWKS